MLKHKRLVSIIATLAFCLSFLAPAIIAPAPALAEGSITGQAVTVTDDSTKLGTVKVTIPAGTVASGDEVVFTLPDDCTLGSDVTTGTNIPTSGNVVVVPADEDNPNSLTDVLDVTGEAGSDEIRIEALSPGQALFNDGVFFIYLLDIVIDDPAEGDLLATFEGSRNTGFPLSDEVLVGIVPGDGTVTLSASDTETSNDDFAFVLKIKEDVASALEVAEDSLVLTLPDGFLWDEDLKNDIFSAKTGDNNAEVKLVVKDEELSIDVDAATDEDSTWSIPLSFSINDDSVDVGDVICDVSGDSDVSPDELIVGEYGDFGVEVTCEETPEVFAGKLEQEIGTFTIEEIIADSLIVDRYITLTLPSYAKWTSYDKPSGLEFVNSAGSDGNVLKYRITDEMGTRENPDSKLELEFEDMEVALDVVAPGDLTVTIGGNAAVEAEVVVAKVALPVTMKAENVTDVKIGSTAKIGDLVITESVKGAITDDKELYLKVPAGCEWAKVPTITVESGDLKLDLTQARKAKHPGSNYGSYATTDYYQFIIIPVDRDSNEASVIKVTDCYVTVDRTVPEGALTVGLLGSAVLESNIAYGTVYMEALQDAYGTIDVYPYPLDLTGGEEGYRVGSAGMFPQTSAIAGAAAATVVTPSQGSGVVSFYIGSQVYTVNGVQQFMDVAPYINAGRTYVPVRFLSEALGADVSWDEATKTVTVTKGDKTVVLVIGSTIAKVNGADVQMDVAPEIAGVGRTMLPARYVAEGLGYQVGWIPTLKQVVIQ